MKKGNLDHIDGIIYVYDLSNPTSVINLQLLHSEIRSRGPSDFSSLIVGNKADLLPSLAKSAKGL
jgi:ribosome biogenesis GTPase A